MIKLLTFSSLYPNRFQPRHGIFVEQRLRKLLESGAAVSRVVAPVPWFPSRNPRFGRYAVSASVPAKENHDGIEVLHPRYPSIPKVGMSLTPRLMAAAMKPVLRRIIDEGYEFDILDAHYFYPDGVAATALGRWLGKPVVVTCRGDDVMYFPRYRAPRGMILNAARQVAEIVTVSGDLKRRLCAYGVPEEQVTVLRNGVDLDLFRPCERDAVRAALGIEGRTLLSVGHLVERKGHHYAIEALSRLPDYRLIIIGERGTEDGGMERELRQQVERLGLVDRVRFVGNVSQDALRDYYGAADALALATRREGMPNVMLESLACGNPVIATPVGGIPEVMTAPEAGRLMAERSTAALVAAVEDLFTHYPSREETRRFAGKFSWKETTLGQIALFKNVLGRQRALPTLDPAGHYGGR